MYETDADRERYQHIRDVVAGLTDRVQAKADRLAARVRESSESGKPDAQVFGEQVQIIVLEARRRWEPAADPEWWETASIDDMRRAYIAAVEYSRVDSAAAEAAAGIRERFGRGQ